jgi:hypothetical protein
MNVNPEELGAFSADLQQTHTTRCGKLCQWFASRSFYFDLCITEVTESYLDKLQYSFFGKDRKSISPSELLSKEHSPIGTCLAGLWGLLESWSPAKDGPWRVLALSGWGDFESADVRLSARSHVLGLAASVILHYDHRFSSLPWSMSRLIDDGWSDAERADLCESMLSKAQARPCCLPLFTKEFLHMYPTRAQVMSAAGLHTIRMWLANKRFSTKASELGHSTERSALAAANAPGKSFVPHAQRDFLHKHRVTHMSRGGVDPIAATVTKGRKVSAAVPADAPDPFEAALPPALSSRLPPCPAVEAEGLKAVTAVASQVSIQDLATDSEQLWGGGRLIV